MESILNKFTKAISYTFLASVIARLFGVIIGILIARSLGIKNLGLYAIVQSVIGLFATVFSLGLGLTATKLIAQYCKTSSKKLSEILGLLFSILVVSLLVGGVIYSLSLKVLISLYSLPALESLLKMGIFLFVFIVFNQFLESILVGFQAFKSQMFVTSIISLLNLIMILIVISVKRDNILINLIVASAIVAFLQSLILIIFVAKELNSHNIKLSITNSAELVKPYLINFSLPAFLTKIAEQPLNWISIFLLVKLGSDISNVGGLNVINNIKGWLLYFPSILSVVLIPILTDIYHTREKEVFCRALVLNQKFLWLATLPVLVFFISIMRPLIEVLFGVSYVSYWQAGVFLLAWAVLIPINEVNDRAMISVGKMWLSLGFRMIYMIILPLMLVLLVPRFQLLGYVLATGISFFIYVLIQTVWLNKFVQHDLNVIMWLMVFSFFVLSVSCFTSQYLIGYMSLLCGLIFSSLILLFEWKFLIDTSEKSFILEALTKIIRK